MVQTGRMQIAAQVKSMTRPLTERVRKLALQFAMRGKESPIPDITTLRKIPEHLTFPLRRDGVDPVPLLAESREQAPVTKLGSVLGLDIVLVTGHAESKHVLADKNAYSNDSTLALLCTTSRRSGWGMATSQ